MDNPIIDVTAKPSRRKKTGRPSSYTEKLADEICERIADGEALHIMCQEPEMPSAATVYRWLEDNISFRDKYARARSRQADKLAAEIVDIADAVPSKDKGALEKARLRMDARKWAASKLAPKKYSDKVQQEISGPDGVPVQHAVAATSVSPEEFAKIARGLLDEV